MTNAALAVSMDPSFAKKVKPGHFYMMGGSHLGMGNTTYTSEFNVYSDPEAAEICFQRFQDIVMISWEQTLEVDLSWEWSASLPCVPLESPIASSSPSHSHNQV